MFICKLCGIKKDAAEYRIHARGYRIGQCRQCERDYQREWSRRNPDKYRARKREIMALRRASNPDAVRAYGRNYYAVNSETQKARLRAYYKRRFFWSKAMKLRGDGRATARQIAALWKQQCGRCALTGRRLNRAAQLDHKIPKARGGGDGISNLQWLCEAANLAKRDLTDAEFVTLCEDVIRWLGERIELVESVANEMEVAA